MIKRQRMKDLSEVSIVIDTWDDVFSDFDPRPLSERTVSGDFIDELKKRYREQHDRDMIIKLFAPEELQDKESELMVTRRLQHHFDDLCRSAQNVRRQQILRGVLYVLVGSVSLSSLVLMTYYQVLSKLVIELLGVVLMPLGWFGVWEGFSRVIDGAPSLQQDIAFYGHLAGATYRFEYISDSDLSEDVE
jgi:hypothetical protein